MRYLFDKIIGKNRYNTVHQFSTHLLGDIKLRLDVIESFIKYVYTLF